MRTVKNYFRRNPPCWLAASTMKYEKGHSGLDPESLYRVEVIYMKCCGLDKEICNAETEMLNRVQHDNEQELGYKLIFGRTDTCSHMKLVIFFLTFY